ncbi:MAG: non-canonical purine NTP diphosphatase [Bacteroidetes bacterium]|nr:non-canonical purine NTP diphosphatase [Bacteroidota bacterium]
MDLVFATNNQHKIKEIRPLIIDSINLLSLSDINCFEEIPETQHTLKGNASQKSHFVFDKFGVNCFADDTGLEIEALNGDPGVYSARYAGEGCSFQDNIEKVLLNMDGNINRKAKFTTVISLLLDGKEYFFEGFVNGIILTEKLGKEGFGYDPIFMPEGYNISFAEMTLEEKNKISHRAMAVNKLAAFLNLKPDNM